MTRIFATCGLLAAMAGGACAPTPADTEVPSFGNAVRHNMALHILNPDVEASAEAPALDGARAGVAMERYRAGAPTATDEAVKWKVGITQIGE